MSSFKVAGGVNWTSLRSWTILNSHAGSSFASGLNFRTTSCPSRSMDSMQLRFRPHPGHAPVDGEPLVHVGDVALVDPQVHAQVDVGPDIVLDLLALQLLDGLFEELHVHVEADRLDLAALL